MFMRASHIIPTTHRLTRILSTSVKSHSIQKPVAFSMRTFSSKKPTVTDLIEAVQTGNQTAITSMAKIEPRLIAEQTNNDNTALHEAAKRGDVAMIDQLSQLFSEHFNVNHKCHCYLRRTPAHYATEGGHIDALKKLISLGANLNITDEKGRTVLDYAVTSDAANRRELVAMITSAGGTAEKNTEEAKTIIAAIRAEKITAALKLNAGQIVSAEKGFNEFLNNLKKNRK